MRRVLAAAVVVLCTLATATACGDDSDDRRVDARPRPSRSPSRATTVTPSGERVEVDVDQPIDLVVTADAPGEIHVHSEPEQRVRVPEGHHDVQAADRQAGRGRGRVAHPRQGHRAARGPLGRASHSSTTSSRHTGSVARRTCRSRCPWRSAARWPPWWSRSRSGRRLAYAALRRRHQRPTSAGLAGRRWSRSVPFRAALRVVGFALFAYTAFVAVAGQDLFINPIFGLFYVVLWVGAGLRLGLPRAGVEGDQPGPHHQPGLREAVRQRPGPGRLRLPGAARLLAGGPGPLRVRVDGAGLPLPDRAGLGPALGLPSTSP